jgi:hypothetical protein
MVRIALPLPGAPQYEDDPTQVTLTVADNSNVSDYLAANPGQWFYGVVDTLNGNVYLVPGNVHDDPQNAQQQNPRMLNTYASKAVVPKDGWKSLSGAEKYNGIGSVPTGHQAVASKYGLVAEQCLGFRVIKIDSSLATFSDRSNSLNGNKPDQRLVQKVPYGTNPAPAAGVQVVVENPQSYAPSTTARMPPQWATAVRNCLSARLFIVGWAVDF